MCLMQKISKNFFVRMNVEGPIFLAEIDVNFRFLQFFWWSEKIKALWSGRKVAGKYEKFLR